MGTYIGRGSWHHMGSVVNGLAKFLCGISQDGSSCDSLLHWLQDNIISQSQISSVIFSTNPFFCICKKKQQQSLECLMSNFLSNSASTSLQVNSTCVCDPCRKRNRRRQTPCVTLWFFLFFCAPQARSQMSSLPIWSSPTPQKEMCVSKSRRLHLADTACARTVASLMLGHP